MELRLLVLDTSLTSTGYAVFYVSLPSFNFRLVEHNVIDTTETDFGVSTDSRARLLISKVSLLIDRHRINCIATEEPPGTVYGWKKMPRLSIVARANSVMKVVAATYALIGFCFSTGKYIRVIQPSQWQTKPKSDKTDIKKWSVTEANKILAYLRHKKRLSLAMHHTADAINIGIVVIKKFHNKEWELPTLTENE